MSSRWVILLLLIPFMSQAQMPDLNEGEIVFQKSFGERTIRLWQIPPTAREHIPIRFLFEETIDGQGTSTTDSQHSEDPDTCVLCAQGGAPIPDELTQALTAYDSAMVEPEAGSEAAYSFAPKTHPLHFWNTNLLEIRETFRTAGNYQLNLNSPDYPALDLKIDVKVEPARYISFAPEFGTFVLGCGIIGIGMIFTVKHLHNRSRENAPQPVTQS